MRGLEHVSVSHVHADILEHINPDILVQFLRLIEYVHVLTVAPNAMRFHAVPSSTARHLLPPSPSVQNTNLPAVPADGNALTA